MPRMIDDPNRKLERMIARQNKRLGLLDDATIKRLRAKLEAPTTLGGMRRKKVTAFGNLDFPDRPGKPSKKKKKKLRESGILPPRAKWTGKITHEQIAAAVARFEALGGVIRKVEPESVEGSRLVTFGGRYQTSIMVGFHETEDVT